MTISIATGKRNAQLWRHRRLADWLGLAASPTFALMAWFAAGEASGPSNCPSASGPLPVNGMVWMYLLMCLFHISPWLKLVSGNACPTDHPTSRIEGE